METKELIKSDKIEIKELLQAYNVVKWATTQNVKTSYNQSFIVVQNWLANKICIELENSNLLKN